LRSATYHEFLSTHKQQGNHPTQTYIATAVSRFLLFTVSQNSALYDSLESRSASDPTYTDVRATWTENPPPIMSADRSAEGNWIASPGDWEAWMELVDWQMLDWAPGADASAIPAG